eukprot:TRINITY_DN1882_c0_g1_i1.p1 TRINITY_DN1882_c0_g1~~TRINITY_DN1882_c0_g1_i1.p1  ORF type:complete len:1017 (+),score=344.72 TRINITY_DN1882_c0_g1_i1:189-3239(+)
MADKETLAGVDDEGLYSRQKIMLGERAMKSMAQSTVLISGLGGLGVEIAKNVALAGIKALTLHDTKLTQWTDLATNFYLSPADIGKNRAEISLKQVSQLNPYVKYHLSNDDLANVELSFFDQFKCVILTDAPLATQLRVSDYCHSKSIRFISSDARGVFTQIFCDFGENFEVFDDNGEEVREVHLGNVTQANPGVVTTLNDEKHGFEDGDLVTFREVHGMNQLNGTTHEIKVTSPTTFSIGDTSAFSAYSREGIIAQVKKTLKFNYKSLRDSLAEPSLVPADFAKMEAPAQLHLAFRTLHHFAEKNGGKFPGVWNSADAQEFLKIARDINDSSMVGKIDKIDEDLFKKFSFTSQGNIAPLTSFAGGVAAQETLKALSGKYTPLNQYVYLDAVEVLPPLTTDSSQFQPKGNREDGQVICLGRELCDKMANTKLFMIGCGAIGCEMLKNYAMMGIATGPNGRITITDNDLIEKSNLNRQFLFRSKDIQKPKSETAANAVTVMNPAIKITSYLDKVGPETESKYSDAFFEGLDVVVNALDNVAARLYVDSRIVANRRPLLESGTLGPKGHVQVVLPFKTESYGSKRDPPEKDVPFCTLKSFPSQIEHCIEWARDFSFGGLFVSKPLQWNQLIDEENLVERLGQPYGAGIDLKIVRTGAKLLKTRPQSYEDCLAFARKKFENYFVNKTLQLLHNFPLDHKIDEKGTLFWSSPKRPPTVISFDWNDTTHRNFVISLANLYAEVWQLPRYTDLEKIKKVVESVQVPKFVPKSKRIETDESKKKEDVEKSETENNAGDEVENSLKEVAAYFKNLGANKSFKLKPIDFEKDDDTNFHIDFIASTANLRARMYTIPEADRLRIKAIAGRIMPAIATTTAAVSGCVALELVKIVKGCEKLEDFKNLFMNLGLPFWAFTEPGPAEGKKITAKMSYTLWDSWDLKKGDITLDEFIKHFKATYNLDVSGVFKGAIMLYVPMFPGHAKRKPMKISALTKKKPDDKYDDLTVTFSDETGEDVSGPPVRFYY